jgi:ubiquinone/menaquinone biosynthesis C-methylase UbiE
MASNTPGLILHRPAHYDLLVWLLTLGRERTFRDKVIRLARLAPGERVLDVGCGTGTLAIAAKRHVGPSGAVCGIDASPEMIAQATAKAGNAGIDVTFERAAAQALPFPDAHFDVVLSSMMLHHLPRKGRQQCAREMSRVLKPGGRVLAVDFATSGPGKRGLLRHFHRHGHVAPADIVALLSEAGLAVIDQGAVGFKDLQFALGRVVA